MNFQNEEFLQVDELELLTETSDDINIGIYCESCDRVVSGNEFSAEFDKCWDCANAEASESTIKPVQ